MKEPELKIPPWSKKRRILTATAVAGFILLASGFIGFGFYQIGVQTGTIAPPLSRNTLMNQLLQDAGFLRAAKHAALRKTCANQKQGFSVIYEPPLHPARETGDEACLQFLTIHPTGATTTITIEKRNQSREALMTELAQRYPSVRTDSVAGTRYQTSYLTGYRKNVPTTQYIIATSRDSSFVVTYLPTSPVIDGSVTGLVESFSLL